MLNIGALNIPSRILLAPLAGISDLPFRLINRSFGCEFAFTEMLSAQALVYRSRHTLEMLASDSGDQPLGVQLLGDDPAVMRDALAVVRESGCSLVDVNAACPVNKVVRRGQGAGLLREPRKLGAVLRSVVEHAGVPVTVKIRSGWDEHSVNAKEVARLAMDAGVHGIIVHGRTRVQGYRGRVDYDVIRKVKDAVDIPVVASGDALNPLLVKKLFDETGCDGVAIARGALGNPWIFRRTSAFLETGDAGRAPDLIERCETMRRHLYRCTGFYGDRRGVILFRKFFGWYIKGVPEAKQLKEKAFRARTQEEMAALIDAVLLIPVGQEQVVEKR